MTLLQSICLLAAHVQALGNHPLQWGIATSGWSTPPWDYFLRSNMPRGRLTPGWGHFLHDSTTITKLNKPRFEWSRTFKHFAAVKTKLHPTNSLGGSEVVPLHVATQKSSITVVIFCEIHTPSHSGQYRTDWGAARNLTPHLRGPVVIDEIQSNTSRNPPIFPA